MKAKRVVVYVDDETFRLDVGSISVESGVVLEIRQVVHDGDRIYTDPVVTEVSAAGAYAVDTRIEAS